MTEEDTTKAEEIRDAMREGGEIADDFKPRFGWPISNWYRYFAWYPISTWDRGYRWMTLVWKRKCQPYDYLADQSFFYQYRVSSPPEENK